MSASHLHQQYRQVHTLIILFTPSFYALVSILKQLHDQDLINMWVFGKQMRQYLLSCLLSNPWELLLRLLILLCYARRRGLGLSDIHDRCEIVNIWLNLRWQLKLTSGWIEVPAYSRIACLFWTATQAQRDHKIVHARNFRVQPHAIMGSSIVD